MQSTVEAEYLISKIIVENQIMFDPMMGTGTTEIADVKLRRQFLGMERMCKYLKMQKETSVQE